MYILNFLCAYNSYQYISNFLIIDIVFFTIDSIINYIKNYIPLLVGYC